MKFGKQLKDHSVPEWQESYMSYKRLKRIIKKLCLQIKEQKEKNNNNNGMNSNEGESNSNNNNNLLASPSSSSSSLLPSESTSLLMGGDARKEFFSVFEGDIEKVNQFYTMKEEEIKSKYETIEGEIEELVKDIDLPEGFVSTTMEMYGKRGKQGHGKEMGNGMGRNDGSGLMKSQSFHASHASPSHSDDETTHSNDDLTVPHHSHSHSHSHSHPLPPDNAIDIHSYRLPRSVSSPIISPHHYASSSLQFSNSQQKQLESSSSSLLSLYRTTIELLCFSELNFEGLRKIMKKYDKNTGESHQLDYIKRMKKEPFKRTKPLMELGKKTEELYIRVNLARGIDSHTSINQINHLIREIQNPNEGKNGEEGTINYKWIVIALIVAFALNYFPYFPSSEPRARKCLSLLGYITVLWISEAVPFFVASLSIPFFVIIAQILADPISGEVLSAERASRTAFGYMFNDTIMLIIGGFSLSTAFSKCQFELRLAAVIQRLLGSRPRLFLLAFMLLGSFLSMWISNVAAPVLLTSLLLPIVRDYGSQSQYAKCLLLGLAISCNIGGMMSPISSPQNAISLGYLENNQPDYMISFTEWLSISIPFCTIGVLISWLYLIFVYLKIKKKGEEEEGEENSNENDAIPSIPSIVYEKTALSRTHIITLLVCILTIGLWCSLSYTRGIVGTMGTVSVIPVVILFGCGILTKNDLTSFSWNLILLIGGGNVLGAAVNSSRLLTIVSGAIAPYLLGSSLFITVSAVLLLVFFITTFVSHTVAALILTPLIVSIGLQAGHLQLILLLATLMMSGTMSLPMSSFPNVNSLLVDDDFGRPFLHPKDYLIHGTVVAVALLLMAESVGYGLCLAVFGAAGEAAVMVGSGGMSSSTGIGG